MIPVPVDQRCEFLSDAWVAEAVAFLRREVPQRGGLRGVRQSVCEIFDRAPPGLGKPGNEAAWHFELQDGCVEAAGPGSIADADLQVTGRYQVALAYAQVVHAAGPEAVDRMHRAIHLQFGDDGLNVRGTMPDHPDVLRLLSDLHDHMAARTVENPHFEHRVAELGLDLAVQHLAEDGYAVIENAIPPESADALCELTAREVTEHHPLTTNGLMMRHRRFEELAQHTPACTLAQSAVGQNMILGAMSGTYKGSGPGAIPPHADYPLVREPYPEFGLIAVAVWALQDWDGEAVGPTWLIPGSHRLHRPPHRDEVLTGGVPILVPRGSVLVMSHGIWHWQGDRSAPGARVAVHVTYNRVFVRRLDDFSAVDDSFLARNPPAFSTLMGRDDPFGKSSYQGHDAKRFAYAGRFLQT